jgi:hypothetical protein
MWPGTQPRVTCFCIDPLMHECLKTRPRGSPLTNPLEQAAFLQLVRLNNTPAAGCRYLCTAWLTAWPQRWPGIAVRPCVCCPTWGCSPSLCRVDRPGVAVRPCVVLSGIGLQSVPVSCCPAWGCSPSLCLLSGLGLQSVPVSCCPAWGCSPSLCRVVRLIHVLSAAG